MSRKINDGSVEKKTKESPLELATREYYDNATPEAIREENDIAQAFQQTADEINFDE
jgi:hypothetical protein